VRFHAFSILAGRYWLWYLKSIGLVPRREPYQLPLKSLSGGPGEGPVRRLLKEFVLKTRNNVGLLYMTNPVGVWDFTLPDPANEMTSDQVMDKLQPLFKKWAFQKEKGDGGLIHYQGRGSLFKKRRFNEIRKLFVEIGWDKVHLTPSSNNSQKGDCFYTMKMDTRVEGPWTDKDIQEKIYIPRQYRGILDNLRPWQQKVWDSADEFDPRSINVIYDSRGNNGKSTIASVMDLHRRGLDLPPMNDSEKLIQSIADILIARELREPKVIFVDLPRAMDKRKLGSLYTAIEQIKKGKVYDMRYRYQEWWFDSPQVWVFTNIDPDQNLLSRDRWNVWTIDNDDLVPIVPIT